MEKRKELIKSMIKEFDLKDANDIKDMMKELMGSTIEEMLKGELEEELGYEKHDYANKKTVNSRNGFSKKTVRSDYGDIAIKVPRDRNGEFEPEIIKKNQKELGGIEKEIRKMIYTTNSIENFNRQLRTMSRILCK